MSLCIVCMLVLSLYLSLSLSLSKPANQISLSGHDTYRIFYCEWLRGTRHDCIVALSPGPSRLTHI